MTADTKIKRAQCSNFKRRVYVALEDVRAAQGIARVCGVVLIALIVVNAMLVFAEPELDLTSGAARCVLLFGFLSGICFGVEYAARLWIADLVYPNCSAVRARVRYVLSPLGIIDLLSFLPGLLAFVVPLSASTLNAARIVRLLRLIKLSRYMRGLHSIASVFDKRRHEIIAACMVLGLLTITASVLMYEVEHPVQPDQFDSVFTGMYWAMTTITTTGYGDLVPITGAGRLIGFATMVLSIGVVAIPAGIFSAGFVSEFRAQDARERDVSDASEDQDDREDEAA